MKRIMAFLLCTLIRCGGASAQAPQSINYQGGVYQLNGFPYSNHAINLRMSILDSSASGPVVYSEGFITTTDINGLFNISLGTGIIISGSFPAIDWSNGLKWLKTEIDTGSGSYQLMGSSRFLTVPYALYAEKSNSSLGFGSWSGGYQVNKVYKAQTDGFVNVSTTGGDEFNCTAAIVFSDSTSNPQIQIGSSCCIPTTLIVPVRKNDYWRVPKSTCSNLPISSIRWLPLK